MPLQGAPDHPMTDCAACKGDGGEGHRDDEMVSGIGTEAEGTQEIKDEKDNQTIDQTVFVPS